MVQTKLMVWTKPMVQTQTCGTDMDSWYRHGQMVQTWTHGIDLKSWYSIVAPESYTYKRAECCSYAGLFGTKT